MADVDPISELERTLAGYPQERYPLRHAAAQLHLGVLLTNAGRLDEATVALGVALSLFEPHRYPVEHAKALVTLGATLRGAGQAEEAASRFQNAADLFRRAHLDLEEGAALFNLGLVETETGEHDRAVQCFTRARELLDEKRVPAQAAAATRELGGALLLLGRPEDAGSILTQAIVIAERAEDISGKGAAANALGLALLATGRTPEAIEAFETAVGASPRRVRPEGYAIARCNLALAYLRQGRAERAGLCARQAAAVPGAPAAVVGQASAILADPQSRPRGDLLSVLDDEPVEMWLRIIGEDLMRWTDLGASERRAEASTWFDGLPDRPAAEGDLAEALLGALLELPPDELAAVTRSLLEALDLRGDDDKERFASATSRAMARFPIPQWTRLRATFSGIGAEIGQGELWK